MAAAAGVIGPNAVLQHAAVIRRHGGEARLAALMAAAALDRLPTGDAMIPRPRRPRCTGPCAPRPMPRPSNARPARRPPTTFSPTASRRPRSAC